ncbi:helix-turn-helix domain-containing protein [Endozoicomonas sp.]|uniref:helix-turn-helix domain-containing protein n=1 Tax=Endozoicomonas sp. TaxID=1892382 RepID=UPI003AF868C6
MSNINKRIELIRKLEGLTRGELAQKCGISEQSLENIEFGKQRTPADLVEQLCILFPFASNYLITGKAEIKFTKKEKEKIKQLAQEVESIEDLDTEISKRRRAYRKNPLKE